MIFFKFVKEYRTLNDEIRQFYFGNDSINVNKSNEYIALLSDMNFFYGIDKTAKLHALKSKGRTFYARLDSDDFQIFYNNNNWIYWIQT